MSDLRNKPEPKKIKMPPLVDLSKIYDTMDWDEADTLWIKSKNENYNENHSQGLPELESK